MSRLARDSVPPPGWYASRHVFGLFVEGAQDGVERLPLVQGEHGCGGGAAD